MLLTIILIVIFSYLIGSINTAILISVFHKEKDIRRFGSGSAGMTNMLRTFGKRAAYYTFLGDFLKGVIVVVLSRILAGDKLLFDPGYIAAFFAIVGHIFPLYFEFKGGKGVATSFGAMLALNPIVFVTILIGLVPMIFIIRIVSAVSLTGASLYPVLTFLVLYLQGKDMSTIIIPNTILSLAIAGLTFFAHRSNIKRLKTGSEFYFEDKKSGQNKKDNN